MAVCGRASDWNLARRRLWRAEFPGEAALLDEVDALLDAREVLD